MIFKVEKRRFRKNGVLRLTRHYFLRYRFGDMPVDRWKSLRVADKQVAEKKALEFRQEKEREAAGILEPKALRAAATTPLTTHLEDYLADLQKRNRTGRNGRGGRQLKMRVTTLLNECKWNVAYNISVDSFIAWRRRQEKSARTLNHYLQAMVSFLNWLERMGRIKGNPLKFVGKVDERGKLKRTRRALTDDELRRVVAGSDWRGLVYLTAARTGLRQEELRQLIWDDLRLEKEVPHVRVRVVCAKNKTEEQVELVPEICEALKAHRPPDYSPNGLVFEKGVPRAARLRADLETNEIAYQDELGRYADFHALRYTWTTFLQRNGIAQRFAMKLLRHSDIRLTSKVYTDESQLPIYEAIKNLPRLVEHTQIRAQISDGERRDVTEADVKSEGEECGERVDSEGFGRELAQPVASRQRERVKGIEPSFKLRPSETCVHEICLRPDWHRSDTLPSEAVAALPPLR